MLLKSCPNVSLLSSARTFTLAFPKHETLRSSSHEKNDVGPDSAGIPKAVAAAQGSEHVLVHSPWHRATAPGQQREEEQAAFIAEAELFSHHKSLRTAQLFLWWTPGGAGFAALLFHP